MTQEGLFRVNGSMKMVEQLRLQYERGEEVELVKDGDVYSAASLLKLFLRELPDGIITSALHPRFIQLYQGKWEVKSPSSNALSFWIIGYAVSITNTLFLSLPTSFCISFAFSSHLLTERSQLRSSVRRDRKLFHMCLIKSRLFMIP